MPYIGLYLSFGKGGTFFLPKRKISIWFNDYYSSNSFLILYVENLYLRSVTETNIDKYINVHTCSTLFVLYMHIERFRIFVGK